MLYHYIYSKLHFVMHVNSQNMLHYSYSMIYWQYTVFYPQKTPWWWPCADRSAGVGSGGNGEGQEWHTSVWNKAGHWGERWHLCQCGIHQPANNRPTFEEASRYLWNTFTWCLLRETMTGWNNCRPSMFSYSTIYCITVTINAHATSQYHIGTILQK